MAATMARKKKTEAADPPADRHKHNIMAFRPPPELRADVVAIAEAERRSVAQMVQILVEEAVAARKKAAEKKGGA